MKQQPKTQYRFYRPRRPGGLGDGLKFEGVTSKFGLIGIGVLMLVGVALLLANKIPSEKELYPVEAALSAPPYRSSTLRNTILIPFKGAMVMKLDASSLAAVDTPTLFALQKNDLLKVYLQKTEADNWNAGVGRKDFYTAILIQKANDATWVVDYKSYRKKAAKSGSPGWWLIVLGAMLIPYQLIQKPKIPVWGAIALYILAAVLFYFS